MPTFPRRLPHSISVCVIVIITSVCYYITSLWSCHPHCNTRGHGLSTDGYNYVLHAHSYISNMPYTYTRHTNPPHQRNISKPAISQKPAESFTHTCTLAHQRVILVETKTTDIRSHIDKTTVLHVYVLHSNCSFCDIISHGQKLCVLGHARGIQGKQDGTELNL